MEGDNHDHAAQLWRELVESSVECELCNEPYDEREPHLPRLLSCGHTFCQSCLEEWSAVGSAAGLSVHSTDPRTGHAQASMECPTCRRTTSFNAVEGPRALSKNFELLRVRQEMESQTATRLNQLREAWTTQVLDKERLAREAEEHAMLAQQESVQAAQRALFLAKQVEINEQEKLQAQEMAQDARRRALQASQQAEALQAETELLKQRLQQEALQLQRVKNDATSAALEAKQLHSRAEQLELQVEAVRAQLSLHAGKHDPSKLVVLVVEPTTVGSWLMPYTRYAVISIARSANAKPLDPYVAAKSWLKMRHVATPSVSSSVKVYRRYSDFVWLHHELYRRFPFEFVPSIPAKQLFFFNKDKEFVGERMRSLQAFLREILRHPVLATTEQVRAFLLSTTEELENLRNASRLNDDDDGNSFLREVEASEVAVAASGLAAPSSSSSSSSSSTSNRTKSRTGSLLAGQPHPSSSPAAPLSGAAPPSSSSSRSSWAWGAVSALTTSAAKLVTSTGSALTSSIAAGVSTSAATAVTTDDVTERSISSSLTEHDDDDEGHGGLPKTPETRQCIEKRRKYVEIAKAHASVTQKGAHLSRVQRQYAHHLHRVCELLHGMDTLDRDYNAQRQQRHAMAVSMMDHSSTYTARQVEEDARACLESERPFQEKASEVFSALSLATSNDAECMEYALLEISRMQTLHLGAIEDGFKRLRAKEDALQQHVAAQTAAATTATTTTSYQRSGSLSSLTSETSGANGGYYGSPPTLASSSSFSSSSSLSCATSLIAAKREELLTKRQELEDNVARVDPARSKFVLETLQHNVKEMHTLAVARRKLHETSYQQLLAACRAV